MVLTSAARIIINIILSEALSSILSQVGQSQVGHGPVRNSHPAQQPRDGATLSHLQQQLHLRDHVSRKPNIDRILGSNCLRNPTRLRRSTTASEDIKMDLTLSAKSLRNRNNQRHQKGKLDEKQQPSMLTSQLTKQSSTKHSITVSRKKDS